ncbi:hypothetical protein [Candidatus Electronema sp. JC]|uniref:hypothetical protein n=1 Tax=Candidatus Electronema sp. JC TaxID=3401570 RepID=UPI003B43B0B8
METTIIIIVAVVLVLSVAIKAIFFPPKFPESKTFKCARCAKISTHSDRTVEAWRRGFTKLYCSSCHQKWLQSQPQVKPSGGGCVSVLFIAALLPSAIIGFLKWIV